MRVADATRAPTQGSSRDLVNTWTLCATLTPELTYYAPKVVMLKISRDHIRLTKWTSSTILHFSLYYTKHVNSNSLKSFWVQGMFFQCCSFYQSGHFRPYHFMVLFSCLFGTNLKVDVHLTYWENNTANTQIDMKQTQTNQTRESNLANFGIHKWKSIRHIT